MAQPYPGPDPSAHGLSCPMPWIIAFAVLLCTAGLMVGEARRNTLISAITKPSASLGFLAFALALGAHHAGGPGVAFVVGLCLSLVGDVLLLWKARPVFMAGLISFLLGHVAYGVGFVLLGLHPLGAGVACLLLVPVAVLCWRWLREPAGAMAKAVLAYILVISAMVALATAATWSDPSPARLGMLAGAAAFFLSDLTVARDRFVSREAINRLVGLPLYYGAQLALGGLIASAV